MKIKYGILLALLLLLVACIVAPASAAGGSGTASDPYQIQTATELQSMNNNLGAYYILMNDIDLSGRTWTPIGTSSVGFHGSFDGNGKTIRNLVLSSTTQHIGFFGTLTSGATVKDVTFEDCSVSTTSNRCGLVVGYIIMSSANHDVATIDNVNCVRCTVTASTGNVGAICGMTNTAAVVDISNCDVSYTNVESTSNYNVGVIGVVSGGGDLDVIGGSVKNSRFKAPGNAVGVIACVTSEASASMIDTVIDNCIFDAGNSAGAIAYINAQASASMNGIKVKNCVMKANSYAGGLIGVVDSGSTGAATNCDVTDTTIYATSNYAGGVAGRIVLSGVFDGCTVTDCTILADSYAAGICPAYS